MCKCTATSAAARAAAERTAAAIPGPPPPPPVVAPPVVAPRPAPPAVPRPPVTHRPAVVHPTVPHRVAVPQTGGLRSAYVPRSTIVPMPRIYLNHWGRVISNAPAPTVPSHSEARASPSLAAAFSAAPVPRIQPFIREATRQLAARPPVSISHPQLRTFLSLYTNQ
jgi:hypothetical protein